MPMGDPAPVNIPQVGAGSRNPSTGSSEGKGRFSPQTRTVLLFACLLGALSLIPQVDDLERWSFDQRFLLRAPRSPLPGVVIIGIDLASRQWANCPPFAWNRLLGQFVDAVSTASAGHILLDLIFPSSVDTAIRTLVEDVLRQHAQTLPYPVLRDMSFDQPLREANLKAKARGTPRIILGFAWETGQPFGLDRNMQLSVPANQVGFVNVDTDPDLVIRSLPLFAIDSSTGGIHPSVDLALAGTLVPGGWRVPASGGLELASQTVRHLSGQTHAVIDFAGPRGTYPVEPFHQVLRDAREAPVRLARFAGKTLLVGFVDNIDLKRTPVGMMSGIEIHANVLENLIHNRFLRKLPGAGEFLILLGLALALFLVFRSSLRAGLVLGLVGSGAWSAACLAAFSSSLVLPFARPFLLLLTGGLLEGLSRYAVMERERRRLRELFGRYVNDAIIQTILQRPADEFLQGSRRQICVMFADIRGFTSFSENRDPQIVVAFLNLYFAGLTDIILRHNGVVDKFLGDGIMAFFNAPVEYPDYLTASVQAALEIRDFAASSPIREAAGAFPVKVGIALHAGPAVVGNIGSERKTEFTAIGDTVNTASRLESLNKEFATDIIASDVVMEATRDSFEWRLLGEQAIRGKERTVRLFTPARPATLLRGGPRKVEKEGTA